MNLDRNNSSTTALIESHVQSVLTYPAIVADIRERLCPSATILEKVEIKTNIKTNTDNISTTANVINELTSNITNVADRFDHLMDAFDDGIDKYVDTKVQVTFSEAVGSHKIKTIATGTTLGIMKNDDYVKHLGIEHLNNEHVLISLNVTVTKYVKAETEKAIEVLKNYYVTRSKPISDNDGSLPRNQHRVNYHSRRIQATH